MAASWSNKSYIVFYDSLCPLCKKTKRYFERLDWFNRMHWVSIHEPGLKEKFPFLQQQKIQEEIHFIVNGTYLYTGFEAVRRMMLLMPATSLIGALLHSPGMLKAGRRSYKWIAKNRYSMLNETCEGGACSIQQRSN
ncbi:thiol-disulfide oxidoreductase DCC family protein [Thalassobacillus sp. C254]|uniref:thiol-disulfide oxidoreductase DCC family protein n=1 Tax=Thalassobacillus sp. C254 TaxID=1225341 RepID=UPI0006D0628D|nr:DUF393 domain-containing protein [Thalassobacillus sp. C254]